MIKQLKKQKSMRKLALPVFILACFLLLSSSIFAVDLFTNELDLSSYPDYFLQNERLNVLFVVGEYADPEDVVGLSEISNSLLLAEEKVKDTDDDNLFEIDVKGNPQDELLALYMDVLSKKKTKAAQLVLDTTLSIEDLKDKNIILIGGPCVNWVSAHFTKYPQNCAQDYVPGRGNIRIFRNGKGVVILVAGYHKEDTRRAASILANYQDYQANLVGENLKVSSAWIEQITVR